MYENDSWPLIEVNTHTSGSLGALVGKRVYLYSKRASTTPSSTNDYTYTYDAVGNVQVVYRASGSVGQEDYYFTQDAFGNELSSGPAQWPSQPHQPLWLLLLVLCMHAAPVSPNTKPANSCPFSPASIASTYERVRHSPSSEN